MLGRTRRTNRRLQAQVEAILEQRDQAIKDRDDAVSLTSRQAQEINRLRDVATNWTALARNDSRRSNRLADAITRYWTEIGRLRRELRTAQATAAREKERADALAERVHTLTTANQAADWAEPAVVPAAA